MNFGEWLKIRRLAAELTPMDLSRYLGIELATYRDIEADKQGITEAQLEKLYKLEKLKMTLRDMRSRATIIAGKPDEDAAVPEKKGPASPLDALIASVTAKNERDVERKAKARTALAVYLDDACGRMSLKKGQLATQCKVAPDLLDDIEAGFTPGPTVLAKLADGLGVPVSELTALT
ncbi:MAG: hypothetical protein JWM80_612 [Cyanobacteria bacterium RYN_339]|nr:hypothetical protein [Cyanobacteria bacterium RYN_339]